MRFNILLFLVVLSSTIALPQLARSYSQGRDVVVALQIRDPDSFSPDTSEELWKRKGGGGGGGRGGGSSGGGSTGGGRGGTSSGGGSSSSGGKGIGSSSSSTGGRTTTGSGSPPSYGGGRYYGGGASVPYNSGGRSASGISPIYYPAIGTFAFFSGLWLYPVFAYPYTNYFSFHNASSNKNESKPVTCLCEEYSECGCDDNSDQTYINDLIGNGSYAALNRSLVTVADINSTSTILINGTLPNGTTAAGGTDSPNSAPGLTLEGYWVMAALVLCTIFLT
jgi:hypothetical protein